MKNLLIAVTLMLLSSEVFAIKRCEKVDLEEVNKKMENILSEGPMITELKRFNETILGPDRICVRKIHLAAQKGEELAPMEEEVNEHFELIVKGPYGARKGRR